MYEWVNKYICKKNLFSLTYVLLLDGIFLLKNVIDVRLHNGFPSKNTFCFHGDLHIRVYIKGYIISCDGKGIYHIRFLLSTDGTHVIFSLS